MTEEIAMLQRLLNKYREFESDVASELDSPSDESSSSYYREVLESELRLDNLETAAEYASDFAAAIQKLLEVSAMTDMYSTNRNCGRTD